MSGRTSRPVRVRVHARGGDRLEGILRLIEEAGRPRPLPEALGALCARVAGIARADVASAYVREADDGGDVLVLRGNVGFPRGAIGAVRLRVGEGLVGLVAECLRPVSVAIAAGEARYKPVPGLGEERFPAFLAVPILVAGGAGGVLVLQRRAPRAFAPAEAALATALAAPFAYAIERARARRPEADAPAPSRSARFAGTPIAPGLALGRVETLPPLGADPGPGPGSGSGSIVSRAFDAVARRLDRERRRLEPRLPPPAARPLAALALVLEDTRFRARAAEACARAGVAAGLRAVARDYVGVPFRIGAPGGDDALEERAEEIEDLCALVAARAAGRPAIAGGGVLVVERLGAFVALAAAARARGARGAQGVVVGGPLADGSLAAAIARAGALPVVADVAGLFAWARPGDRVLIDGGQGVVRVNPPPSAIERHRRGR